MAFNLFGRLHEAKRSDCDNAWYKDYTRSYDRNGMSSRFQHYLVNDLMGKKIPITEQQYKDDNYQLPLNTS